MSTAASARGPGSGSGGLHKLALDISLWLATACGIGAVAALGLPLLASPAPAEAVLPGSLASGFVLSAPDGTLVSDTSLRGSPYVLLFGYTRCGAPCLERTARVLSWRTRIGADGARAPLPVVVVTVDPEYDTPARMAAFAARAPGPILALTGAPAAVARAARAFNAAYFRGAVCGGGTIINHSDAAYLVTREGHVEAVIMPDESTPSALAKLRALLVA